MAATRNCIGGWYMPAGGFFLGKKAGLNVKNGSKSTLRIKSHLSFYAARGNAIYRVIAFQGRLAAIWRGKYGGERWDGGGTEGRGLVSTDQTGGPRGGCGLDPVACDYHLMATGPRNSWYLRGVAAWLRQHEISARHGISWRAPRKLSVRRSLRAWRKMHTFALLTRHRAAARRRNNVNPVGNPEISLRGAGFTTCRPVGMMDAQKERRRPGTAGKEAAHLAKADAAVD
ncbi:hypothetical protein C8R43DRAFT_952582 [Mycena crocata]|nr:hypothetical protein C8R43DRAFT_952582 [Mycena crocata]